MKRKMIMNYMMVILAWCMFINDYFIIACLFSLVGLLILLGNRRINYWRMGFLALIIYELFTAFLTVSNIPYYFPNLNKFLLLMAINSMAVNENIRFLSLKTTLSYLLISSLTLITFLVILAILPSYLYTLITKTSLLLFNLFIFLPYLLPLLIVSVEKIIKIYKSVKKEPVRL